MTQENTAASTIARVESRLGKLHQDALLNRQRERLGETDALLARLPQQLAQLRSQGYIYKAHLEDQVAQLAKRWPSVRMQASRDLERQATTLQPEIARADESVRRLQPFKTQRLSMVQAGIQRVEDELAAVERRITAAQQAVESIIAPVVSEVQAVAREIQGCERILEWLGGATFTVQPGEGLVAATEASLIEGNDQTEGILFLTDQRLIFERREKVARKKVLFITTSSEVVRELRWQAPLADLERLDASEVRRALARNRELLAVEPRGGASVPRAAFQLGTDSDGWRALVLRCQSGEIGAERAGGAPEVPEYLVPAKCSSCGGSLPQAGRIRGVSSLRCEYCGATIPLERA
jgi:hypothetical protein